MDDVIERLLKVAGMDERDVPSDTRAAITAELVTTEELATLLRRDPSTLRRWRTSRPLQGPPFLRLSSGITMYDMADVRLWLTRSRVDPAEAA